MLTLDALSPFQNTVSLKIRILFVVYLLILLLVGYYSPVRSKISHFPGIRILFINYIGIGVLTAAIMKSVVFWNVKEEALYSHDLLFYTEDGGTTFLRKISGLPDYMGLKPEDSIPVYRQLVALLVGDRPSARHQPT
jgi:hypothetical protein